jgi:hypothetical protein
VTPRPDNKRIRSVYLDKREIEAIEAVSLANGQSSNAVIRIAVRKLLGLPAPIIVVSDELRERFELAPAAGE